MIPNAKIVALTVAAYLACLACLACSSDKTGPGNVCQAAAQCGGDPSGTWQVDSECLSIQSPFDQPECAGTIQDVSVAVNGTVSYASSATDTNAGTQAASVGYEFKATERYSSACLKALGFEGATPDACHGLELLWAGAVSVSCAPQTDACQCDFADAEDPVSDSETFTLANHQILVPNADPVDYCRSGNSLVESASTGSSHSVITMHLLAP